MLRGTMAADCWDKRILSVYKAFFFFFVKIPFGPQQSKGFIAIIWLYSEFIFKMFFLEGC